MPNTNTNRKNPPLIQPKSPTADIIVPTSKHSPRKVSIDGEENGPSDQNSTASTKKRKSSGEGERPNKFRKASKETNLGRISQLLSSLRKSHSEYSGSTEGVTDEADFAARWNQIVVDNKVHGKHPNQHPTRHMAIGAMNSAGKSGTEEHIPALLFAMTEDENDLNIAYYQGGDPTKGPIAIHNVKVVFDLLVKKGKLNVDTKKALLSGDPIVFTVLKVLRNYDFEIPQGADSTNPWLKDDTGNGKYESIYSNTLVVCHPIFKPGNKAKVEQMKTVEFNSHGKRTPRWTEAEKQLLLSSRAKNPPVPYSVIATKLGRTENTVSARFYALKKAQQEKEE